MPQKPPARGTVTIMLTPSDFDVAAALLDAEGRLVLAIPPDVLGLVRTAINARTEGRASLMISLVFTDTTRERKP